MAEFLTIAEAARRIAARDLSPVELLESCLARIDAVDAQLNSFVTLTRPRRRRPRRRSWRDATAARCTAFSTT